jgi:hypothetical protein
VDTFFPEDWPKALEKLLGGTLLDSVIDSAGGPISQQVGRVLRSGGRIVLYGMSAAQQVPFTMREVLRNQQLIGKSFFSTSAVSCNFYNVYFKVPLWARRPTCKLQPTLSRSTGSRQSSRASLMDSRMPTKVLTFWLAVTTLARSSSGWTRTLRTLKAGRLNFDWTDQHTADWVA